jgi:hypothetical protein
MQKGCCCIGCKTKDYYNTVRKSQNNSVVTPLKVQKHNFSQEIG